MARVRSVSSHHSSVLEGGWVFASAKEGSVLHPRELDAAGLDWAPAIVPGTAASSMRAAGRWSVASDRDLDLDDWWFRGGFELPARAGARRVLLLEGLATL